jgi:hypothetical protein
MEVFGRLIEKNVIPKSREGGGLVVETGLREGGLIHMLKKLGLRGLEELGLRVWVREVCWMRKKGGCCSLR